MFFSVRQVLNFFLFFFVLLIFIDHGFSLPGNSVMTIGEFKQAINCNKFLKEVHLTIADRPLNDFEIEMIQLAIKQQHVGIGYKFDKGRELNKFKGNILFVGGGKLSGPRGENDGVTVLIDCEKIDKELADLINNLKSGKLKKDPYNGKTFYNSKEVEAYIENLEEKRKLYRHAFRLRNQDILDTYYTLNIEKNIKPDVIASITSSRDTSFIPYNKFDEVKFENVPCNVFLNPNLYKILERITKPGGKINLSINPDFIRLIVPVVQNTKFGKEFLTKIKEVMRSKNANFNIIVTN